MKNEMKKNGLIQHLRSFAKDTRGIVMMGYIYLGVFAVACCIGATMLLGWTYVQGLNRTSNAAIGNAQAAADFQDSIHYQLIDYHEAAVDQHNNITDPPTATGMGYKEFDLQSSLGFTLDDD